MFDVLVMVMGCSFDVTSTCGSKKSLSTYNKFSFINTCGLRS
jgi:hypothetical protein